MCDLHAEAVIKDLRQRGMTRDTKRALYAKPPLEQGTMAIAYARWLAARDGVSLNDAPGVPLICEGRIWAVEFGAVQIPIPHWDWDPEGDT